MNTQKKEVSTNTLPFHRKVTYGFTDMAGNILYGIKEYSIGAIKILAKVLITICQLLLEIIKILFIICGTVLKMFLAVFFIGRKK